MVNKLKILEIKIMKITKSLSIKLSNYLLLLKKSDIFHSNCLLNKRKL